ncbi:hypothetical protein N9414_08210 [Nodularia spumigena CCY9414]|nr:hypothetical protein N9414_08210 [Nodularia spumigena CCY9414]
MLLLKTDADVAKLADALDLGSSSERSEGSSPFIRTSETLINLQEKMPGGSILHINLIVSSVSHFSTMGFCSARGARSIKNTYRCDRSFRKFWQYFRP